MLNKKEISNLKSWARKFFSNDEKDFFAFDIDSEIDKTLTYGENKTILRNKIKEFINLYNNENVVNLTKKEAEIMSKEEYETHINEIIEKVEHQAELEFDKVLSKIEKDKTTQTIEDIYFIPKQYAKMVANGNARGFLLYGEAGLGKTYSIIRAYREARKNFVILSGHITSLELYHFLFEHRREHIVLDDVNILGNEQNLNMLKACLSDNSRVVQYHTSSNKLRVPNKFLFEGSLIILLNKKPQTNQNLKAVESRILVYELKLDYRTKIKVIFDLAKLKYKELTEEQRFLISNWIKDNTSEATKNLNLRLLFQIYEMFRFDKKNWEKMAKKLIKNDERVELILSGLNVKEWCDETGLNRATYYRLNPIKRNWTKF